jgi:hypothetical protein
VDERPAVDVIGEEIVAACAVIPAGYALDVGIGGAGAVAGGAAGIIAASETVAKRRKNRVTPGDHNGDIYAVVGRTQLAFFELKRGLLRKSIGRTLASLPRAELASCQFEPARVGASNLTIELSDGTVYSLQVARVNRGRGQALYDALSS